jgi:hypothetical protein
MIVMIRVGEEELEPNTELVELQASHIWFNKAGSGYSYWLYTVKKVPGFPFPRRDVTYQTPPGRE